MHSDNFAWQGLCLRNVFNWLECINIFLPTTPNPTSGFLLFVPKKDLVHLNMNVEEAIKMVISGGIVTPPDRRSESEKTIKLASAHTYENLEILREKEGLTVLTPKGSRPGEMQEVTGIKGVDNET